MVRREPQVNMRRVIRKKKRGHWLEHSFVRLFLLAMNSGGGSVTAGDPTINEIRKKEYKILIIDDDDGFRDSLRFKLSRIFKAWVEDVNSGKSGIEKLGAGNSYDFIFTDIMMPEMTGIEAYYELRKIDAGIPIVMMSAYSDSDEWNKAQNLKDITLIHKPIAVEMLIKVLAPEKESDS